MKRHMIRNTVLLAACLVAISPTAVANVPMIRLSGTPQEIGRTWGELNKKAITRDMDVQYVKMADAAGISKEMLIERSAEYVKIVEDIAPHWHKETKAMARAVGAPEDLFMAFYGGISRKRFLHECTSYAVSRNLTQDGAILFHKTRDNIDRPQVVFIMESSLEGINKFIGVTDVSCINAYSMIVNEKGLAAAGDYPADRKKDSSTLRLEPAKPVYQGLPGGAFLRYIAERASTCADALAIIEDFVAKGYYSGGKVGGKHWLFVDREGTILEVCNNEKHVASKVHSNTIYFSRLNRGHAAKRLREAKTPIDFHLFHNTARDPSICFGSSISGMTVEIDPTHPELFTCAWVSLPVKAVSFPLLMGQTSTPACLLNGEANSLGKKAKENMHLWEDTEQRVRTSKELLKKKVTTGLSAANPESTAQALDQWSQRQTEILVELLQESQ